MQVETYNVEEMMVADEIIGVLTNKCYRAKCEGCEYERICRDFLPYILEVNKERGRRENA